MIIDVNRKTRAPSDSARAGIVNECVGRIIQYLAARTAATMATMDGPTPQNQAEKATAAKNVMYGRLSSSTGLSNKRMTNAIPQARNEAEYRVAVFLRLQAECKHIPRCAARLAG